MRRRTRAAIAVGGFLLTLALLLLGSWLYLTRTESGRERVRRFALEQLDLRINGQVRVGEVRGDLLSRVELVDVWIADREGRLFLDADTISFRYSLRSLFSRRIVLEKIRLVGTTMILDEPPGEEWNYVRIFRQPDPRRERGPGGWGHWVELRDLALVRSRVQIRTAWEPEPELSPAEQRQATADALAGRTRDHVVRVPRGYQNIMDFRRLNARLPQVLVAHPDSAGMRVEVAALSGTLQPYRPPAAEVRNLSGHFHLAQDSLFFRNVRAVLPESRISGHGVYAMDSGELRLELAGAPLMLKDLHWLYPALPSEAHGQLRLSLHRKQEETELRVRDMDLRAGDSRIQGRVALAVGERFRIQDTRLRFQNLESVRLRRWFPTVQWPHPAVLDGRLSLEGRAESMRLSSDLTLRSEGSGQSRVIASGGVSLGDTLRFRNLRVRVSPLQLALVQPWAPELPSRGSVMGAATLNGVWGDLALDGDLRLQGLPGGRSRVRAQGGLAWGEGRELRFRRLRLQLDPLQMPLLEPWLPERFPARGTLSGRALLDGTLSRLAVDGNLVLRDPATGTSRLRMRGGLARAGGGTRLRGLRLWMEPVQMALFAPFLPEGARAEGELRGEVLLDGVPGERLVLDGSFQLADPRTGTSRFAARGGLRFGEPLRFQAMRLRAESVQMALLREWAPRLPGRGTLAGEVQLDGTRNRLAVDGRFELRDPRTGMSRVSTQGTIAFGTEIVLQDLALGFEPLRLALVREMAPNFPLAGTLTGEVRLSGSPSGWLQLRGGDLRLQDPRSGTSHVLASGEVGFGEAVRFRELELVLDPLRVALLEEWRPDLPVGGLLTGRLVLSGSTASEIRLRGDVEHREGRERSRLAGTVFLPLSGRGEMTTDLELLPLSLNTLGRFVPAAGLQGSVRGQLRTRGELRDLHLVADLRLAEGGQLRLSGLLDAEGPGIGYDVRMEMASANLASLSRRLPESRLTGSARLAGAGTELATLDARLVANLASAEMEGQRLDQLRLRLRASEGLLRVDTATFLLASARGEASGSFGLVAGREGRLSYRITTDSLADFRGWIPEARRVEGDTLAEAGGSGRPTPLSGGLEAEGVLAGNLERASLEGSLRLDDFLYGSYAVGRGAARYQVQDLGGVRPVFAVTAALDSLRVGGVRADSLRAQVRYAGERFGVGTAQVSLFQDRERDYRAEMDFSLALERREVRFSDLALRFDTTTWRTTRPGTLRFAGSGVEVEGLDLRNQEGGRLAIEGRLPVEGEADFQLQAENLSAGHLASLFQREEEVRGSLDLDVRVRGSGGDPEVQGTASLREGGFRGTVLPEARALFRYQAERLVADATLEERGGREVAEVHAELPLRWSWTAPATLELLERPMEVSVRTDSLPLAGLASWRPEVAELGGWATGNLRVGGTPREPALSGDLALQVDSMRLLPLGLRYEEVAARARLEGTRLVIDSLVAHSGGPIRVTGSVDFRTLLRPEFALAVEARDAWIVNSERGQMRGDLDVTVEGALEAVRVRGTGRVRKGVLRVPEMGEARTVVALDDPTLEERVGAELLAEYEDVVGISPFLRNLDMSVALTVDRDVWVRSNEANVEVYTPRDAGPLEVRVDPVSGRLVLEGTVNTDRGEYTFLTRRFTFTRGSALFVGEAEINPFVQVAAEHEVRMPGRRDLQIRIVLGGRLRDLAITLESDAQPPVSQSDLLSFLAFGRASSSLFQRQGSVLSGQGTESGDLVGNVAGLAQRQLAAVAIGSLANEFKNETASSLGLDVFQVTPADVPAEVFSGGGFQDFIRGAEIEAGRYISPRLFLLGQVPLGIRRPGLRLEYRSGRGYEWVTSWEPRYLPSEPSLSPTPPVQTSVWGTFLFREWRF